jgi:hypothetical protein
MHIDDYTIGGSYDCDQISNIYQYIIYRDKLDGKDWKKGELGESFIGVCYRFRYYRGPGGTMS